VRVTVGVDGWVQAVSAGSVRVRARGMASKVIMARAAQPIRYKLIHVLEPVCCRIALAISGATGPS
jgi:hypothetical protein